MEGKDTQLQQKDGQIRHKDSQIQRQGTELRERTFQLNRQLREVQTLRVRKPFSTVGKIVTPPIRMLWLLGGERKAAGRDAS